MHAFRSIRAAALAALLLLAAPLAARAQSTMTFRPVPAESVQSAEDARRSAREARDRVREAVREGKLKSVTIGSGGVTITTKDSAGADQVIRVNGDDSDNSAAPAAPDVPAVPDVPAGPRETTGEIVRFGSDITVTRRQAVQGDVVAMGGDVRVEGTVHGSVTAMGGDVDLEPGSRVDGDVVTMGGTLHESPGSYVGGQRVTTPRGPGGRLFMPVLNAIGTGFQVISHLVSLLFLLGLAFLIVKLAPGRTQGAIDTIRAEPGTSFMSGLLILALIIPSVVALALVMAILCITIIGIPLAVAVAVGYCAFFVIVFVWGMVVGHTLLGARLFERFKGGHATLMQAAMWGLIAVYGMRIVGDVLHIVPVFGFFGGFLRVMVFIVSSVLATLGAGALVRAEHRRRTLQDWWARSRPAQFRKGEMPVDDIPPPPVQPIVAPPPAPVPPPSAPPSPPEAFQPPPSDPPAPIA